MRIDYEALDQMPSARLVITTTSGYEHMDIPALHVRDTDASMPLLVEMRLWTPTWADAVWYAAVASPLKRSHSKPMGEETFLRFSRFPFEICLLELSDVVSLGRR